MADYYGNFHNTYYGGAENNYTRFVQSRYKSSRDALSEFLKGRELNNETLKSLAWQYHHLDKTIVDFINLVSEKVMKIIQERKPTERKEKLDALIDKFIADAINPPKRTRRVILTTDEYNDILRQEAEGHNKGDRKYTKRQIEGALEIRDKRAIETGAAPNQYANAKAKFEGTFTPEQLKQLDEGAARNKALKEERLKAEKFNPEYFANANELFKKIK